jgi:hypothetical protein
MRLDATFEASGYVINRNASKGERFRDLAL